MIPRLVYELELKIIIEDKGKSIISTQDLPNYKIISRVTIPFDKK